MDMCHVWICLEIIFHPPPNEPGNHRYGKTSCWSQPIHLKDCFFLSLRLFNWCSNICWRECNIPIFFSETTVYYENGSRGGKILWCSFQMGKDLSCNVIKTNSTSLMLPPTIEARAPVNGVGRGTSWVQDDAPGRRVITESVISLVNAWRFFLTCTFPPTTTKACDIMGVRSELVPN